MDREPTICGDVSRRCHTCCFWKRPADENTPKKWVESYRAEDVCNPRDPDTAKPMKMPFDVRLCTNPKLLFAERPVEEDGIAVIDGSEYFAALITAAKFGCILHKYRVIPEKKS